MKPFVSILALSVILLAGQPTPKKVYIVTFDPNSTIRMAATDVNDLYETELKPLIAAQIAQALAALPPSGISQATLDAAILAARTQFLQQSQVQWSTADTAMARSLEVQMLTMFRDEVNARLAQLNP